VCCFKYNNKPGVCEGTDACTFECTAAADCAGQLNDQGEVTRFELSCTARSDCGQGFCCSNKPGVFACNTMCDDGKWDGTAVCKTVDDCPTLGGQKAVSCDESTTGGVPTALSHCHYP
jgi:hypothetical protein